MTVKKDKRVLIVEPDHHIRKKVEDALRGAEWEVFSENTKSISNVFSENSKSASNALRLLENSASSPFALLISGFRLPEMQGGELLLKAEQISPFTRRMILIPYGENKALIEAINSANIHACITSPFEVDELVSQAETCYQDFVRLIKTQLLKRVVNRQNRQLYETAKQLKGEGITLRGTIADKKNEIVKLRVCKAEQDQHNALSSDITLARYMGHKNIPLQPDEFLKSFLDISNSVKTLIRKMASNHSIQWEPEDLTSIINGEPETDDKSKLDNFMRLPCDDQYINLIETVKKCACIGCLNDNMGMIDSNECSGLKEDGQKEQHGQLKEYLELIISTTFTSAWLKKKKEPDRDIVNLTSIHQLLKGKLICYGITDDETIESWLSGQSFKKNRMGVDWISGMEPSEGEIAKKRLFCRIVNGDKITIAEGDPPVPGHNGTVEYFFKTDYTNPGRIMEDGSIDFRDKGDIPFVKKGELLAVKTPSLQGTPGKDIYGLDIPVDKIFDPPFTTAAGAVLSDDNLKIVADKDGQPHLDAGGNVSVNQELIIQGDVDLKTGNISFEGNIVVKGAVRQGMSVKGVCLTASEIEGATIELTGELNVRYGILHTTIKTVSNIHAKFINSCHIMGYGHCTVQKEIIDSTVFVSGRCQTLRGNVVTSNLSARQGIEARHVGTESSKPSTLIVGRDEHFEMINLRISADLLVIRGITNGLRKQIAVIDKKNKEIFKLISDNAHIQEKALDEINSNKKALEDFKASGHMDSLKKLREDIKTLEKTAAGAQAEIKRLFEMYDSLSLKKEHLKGLIHIEEEKNVALMNERRGLEAYVRKIEPNPAVRITGRIIQGTTITGPNVSTVLMTTQSSCVIKEVRKDADDGAFFEMVITRQ